MKDNITPIINDIKKQGFKALEDILARKESESFFVDFKLTQKDDYSGQKTLFDSDKKNFAKALSGFGNSEGGIIIWGIEASGSYDDFAKAIKPIKSVENFKSLLESFVSLLTLPAHKIVENFIVKKLDNTNEGLVITIIPKGNDRPYQNISDYKYYMRAGDSFMPIPHGVLQGMFGRSPQSDIFWMFNMGNMGIPEITENKAIKWNVGLVGANGGLGIAEDIYGFARAWVPGDNCQIGIRFSDMENYNFQTAYGVEFSFISKQDFRLGYEQRSQMMVMDLELLPPFTKDLFIELSIGARNQQIYKKSIKKIPEELDKIYKQCISNPSEKQLNEIWGLDLHEDPIV